MKLKEIIKKVKKLNKSYFNRAKYITYYKKLEINNNMIFLEAQHANNFQGNMYYIAKELNDNKYKDYTIYFSINKNKYKKMRVFFEEKNLNNINIVKKGTKKYYKLLASAKYLFTDTALDTCFIKKEGQIIFNTWHGTPLKTLGKKVNNDFHDLGNIQKNFVIADYLLYPNEYMMEHMIEDYMIENISNANIILEGYPRNEFFFDEQLKQNIKKQENLMKKQVIVYMPTWRGAVSKIQTQQQNKILIQYLIELDKRLNENQTLYINLHPFISSQIDYSEFKNIKEFPKNYETYEFLSIADCLITDYSSVFFDFANTRKKVILFTYDADEYLTDRGLYISLSSLPFPNVKTIEQLVKEINSPKNYDDSEFLNIYCKYDNKNVSKRICEKIVLNKNINLQIRQIVGNKKENILIFAGDLGTNGITTSLLNLLKDVDVNKFNYYITFETANIIKNKNVLRQLPNNIAYIPTKGKMNATILKKIIIFLYRAKFIKCNTYMKYMKEEIKNEIKRMYSSIKFSTVIQFNGYTYKKILLYSLFDCNKIIYAHNDMYTEAIVKKNSRLDVLEYAYKTYNKVALVTEDLIEPINKITNVSNKCYIANNLINYKNVLSKSEQEVKFDEKTKSTITEEEFKNILNSKNKKFITIGRFSKEKGHVRLIEAFDKLWEKDKSLYLIIIGGYGKEYKNTLEKVDTMKSKNNIIIIKYVSNPYSILKKCNYFVLSSFYEGFGLVLVEADILNIPVISTDIVGPRLFMRKYGGTLVENSEQGIYNGMKMLLNNKIKQMNIDYEKYNQEAIKQFNNLLD